jgi:hypothetical protein
MEETMDLESLAKRCQEETLKFQRGLQSIASFCLQLWRRALHGATKDERSQAWNYVYAQYTPQLRKWFDVHELSRQIHQHYTDADDFAHTVWFKILAENEKRPLRVDDLREILAYVRRCLVREILMAVRRHGRYTFIPIDPSAPIPDPRHFPDEVEIRERGREVWDQLRTCASKDPRQREIDLKAIYWRWAQRYTPKQIVEEFPGEFANEKAIWLILARIKVCYKRRYGLEVDP